MGEKQRKHILISVTAAVMCFVLFLLLKEIIFPREKMSPEKTMIPEETTSPEEEISPEEILPEETMIPEETTSPEETMIPKERNILSHRVDDTILYLMDVDKDPYEDYELPEGLTEWIAQSLKDGDWEERLKEISAEYKELSVSEKRQYFTEQEAEDYAGLAYYCIEIEPLLLKDKWYLVSLSEYGEDIVIESYDFGGNKCIYCFVNLLGSKVYTEPPMWAVEEREIGSPYFIRWGEINYMAVPVWREESDEILGIEVYDYYTSRFLGVITGIRVDESGEQKIRSQEYLFSTPRGGDLGGTRTLEVLFDEEEE